MKEVTTREVLRDLNKFMRDMYCWCDQDGLYTTGRVSVSRDTIKRIRRCIDVVLEASDGGKVKLDPSHETAYAYLCDRGK